jgi:hypothetical protein
VLLTGVAEKQKFVIKLLRQQNPDENALATKSTALIECFRTVSLPALITDLIITRDYIRYSA